MLTLPGINLAVVTGVQRKRDKEHVHHLSGNPRVDNISPDISIIFRTSGYK
jgi:hypothetical protein